MGQKTNPNIFRLGISKTWPTQFYEKKISELPDRIFVDQEIINYLDRFAQMNKLYLYDYKIQYSNSVINIFLSYFITNQLSSFNMKDRYDIKLLDQESQNTPICISKRYRFEQLDTLTVERTLKPTLFKSKNKFSYLHNYTNDHSETPMHLDKTSGTNFNNNINFHSIKSINLFEQLAQGLNQFFEGKYRFIITTRPINCNFALNLKQMKNLKKKLLLIQRFKNLQFFSEGINICFLALTQSKSSYLIATFISIQLKTLKRHKSLLMFLRRFFSIFLNENFSSIEGVKIMIKGRLNGVPRAKHKTIKIGNVPIQTISSKVSYSQLTTQNLNGSYGIKVWITEK